MKIFVEQIIADQGVIIYSNFIRYTDSEDEDGSDFEYDFDSLYANLDDIQTVIIRLYGTQGLVKLFNYFAEGRDDLLLFEAIEFEEGSELRSMIQKRIKGVVNDNVEIDNIDLDTLPTHHLSDNITQPSDSIFLLNGLLSGLPVDDDLNVMRMLGTRDSNVEVSLQQRCSDRLVELGFAVDATAKYFDFTIEGLHKVIVVLRSSFVGLIVSGDDLILDFPINEMQEKMHRLFSKYIEITQATKMKKSIILETKFNALANSESTTDLSDYLVFFDVVKAKFVSKEKKLTI